MSDNETGIAVLNNAQAFQDRVKETVRATFGMMIPEDQWDAMIAKEVKAFFEDTESNFTVSEVKNNTSFGYGTPDRLVLNATGLTPFRVMVWAEIRNIMSRGLGARVKEHLELETWVSYSSTGEGTTDARLGRALTDKLGELVPEIVQELLRGSFGAIVDKKIGEMASHLNNQQY